MIRSIDCEDLASGFIEGISNRINRSNPTKAKETNSICHQMGNPIAPVPSQIIIETTPKTGSLNLKFCLNVLPLGFMTNLLVKGESAKLNSLRLNRNYITEKGQI
jgi:hypothetical protein